MFCCKATHVASMTATVLAATVVISAPASADPLSDLDGAVNTARAASHCAPLRSDPLVTRSAELATRNTSDFMTYRSAVVPFTDPLPALKTVGYRASKAELFSGYGKSEADSLEGLLIESRNAITDCAYTQYGVSAIFSEFGISASPSTSGSFLTALVLAAP